MGLKEVWRREGKEKGWENHRHPLLLWVMLLEAETDPTGVPGLRQGILSDKARYQPAVTHTPRTSPKGC